MSGWRAYAFILFVALTFGVCWSQLTHFTVSNAKLTYLKGYMYTAYVPTFNSNAIYVWGGQGSESAPSVSIYEYDMRWDTISTYDIFQSSAAPLKGTAGTNSFVYNNTLYFIHTAGSSLHSYNLETKTYVNHGSLTYRVFNWTGGHGYGVMCMQQDPTHKEIIYFVPQYRGKLFYFNLSNVTQTNYTMIEITSISSTFSAYVPQCKTFKISDGTRYFYQTNANNAWVRIELNGITEIGGDGTASWGQSPSNLQSSFNAWRSADQYYQSLTSFNTTLYVIGGGATNRIYEIDVLSNTGQFNIYTNYTPLANYAKGVAVKSALIMS